MEQELTRYKQFLYLSGIRNETIRNKAERFKYLFSHTDIFNPSSVLDFLIKLKEQGRTGGYLNHFISDLRAYYIYLKLDAAPLRKFKCEQAIKEIMSEEQIKRFLTVCCPSDIKRSRDSHDLWTMFFKIACFTGMRDGEVASLTVEDVDLGRNVFVLKQTKTIPRNVPIPPIILDDVKKLIKGKSGYIFISTRTKLPFEKEARLSAFNNRLKLAGIEKKKGLTPHSLRHSFITRMLSEENVDFWKLQKIVGHKRAETTLSYSHLVTADIQSTILKDPLGASKIPKSVRVKNLLAIFDKMHFEDGFRKKIIEKKGHLVIDLRY